MSSRTTPQMALRVTALVAVVLNVIFSSTYQQLLPALGVPVADMGVLTEHYANLFTPAPYAFAIWGVIYAAFLVYAIAALLPGQRTNPVHDAIAPWLIAANVLGSAWIGVFTALDAPTAELALIVLMLGAAAAMYRRALGAIGVGMLGRTWLAPFSLFLGWISVATIANATLVAVEHGAPAKDEGWGIAMVSVAVLLSLVLAARYRDAVYAAVIAWASFALAVGVVRENDVDAFFETAIAAGIVTSATFVVLTVLRIVQRLGLGLTERAEPEPSFGRTSSHV